jgi:hypothetical protein
MLAGWIWESGTNGLALICPVATMRLMSCHGKMPSPPLFPTISGNKAGLLLFFINFYESCVAL